MLEQIHNHDVALGDAHIKNTLLTAHGVYWMGTAGVFQEGNLTKAKAIDLLTLVYSTYTATRNDALTLYAAQRASKYHALKIRVAVRDLVTPGLSAPHLWFPTRLPLNDLLNQEIKRILRTSVFA